jgi:hypothetical protein
VTYHGRRSVSRWQANIQIDGQATYLGVYDTAEEAHAAYCAAALRHFGDFARAG